jgi:type I restriction enzyme M protein
LFNLDIKNPNSLAALEHRPPEELIADMLEKERRVMGIMEELRSVIAEGAA